MSESESDNDSRRSLSPTKPVATPGGLDRSRSNSPNCDNKSATTRDSRSRSVSVHSRSRSGSPQSRRSSSGGSRSRSDSPESNRSESPASKRSVGSGRSNVSNGTRKSQSLSPARSRSGSVDKRKSRSQSKESNSSRKSRSRSGSNASRSPSPAGDEDAGDKRKRSDSDEPREVRKKIRVIDSDSEEGENDEPSAAALFGDADDISSEEEKDKNHEEQKSEDENRRRVSDESDREEQRPVIEDEEHEKEPEPEPVPETRIDVEIPKISCDLGKDIHFVKLPNFLSVETRPFDQETYEDEIDEEETLDEEGRARLKLKVENTIRWREDFDKEGNTIKESNARLVRWSDGSLSLHLGSEIFDVYKQPLQGDHNHLFIRQGTGLQGQAVFRTKLSFRPHSTESFTHRKMTLSLADRSQKVSGIKILSQVGVDPDHDRRTLLKKEEEKLKQTARVKPRKRESGVRSHQRESYREEEASDEEGISLNAIKNKYKPGQPTRGGAIYSSDEEGSDFEMRRSKKMDKPKALKDSEESSGESE